MAISLTFTPLTTNCSVVVYDECQANDVSSEFLPTSPQRTVAYGGRGLYVNDAPKGSTRTDGVTEETTKRVVDIYPESAELLKSSLKVGAIVLLTTEAYGVEEGYLEGVQAFDGSNHIKLVLCLGKA